MGKDRAIIGSGPTHIEVTGTSSDARSPWFKWGPVRPRRMSFTAVFAQSSSGAGQMVCQGALAGWDSTAPSTNITAISVATRLSSQSGVTISGGSTHVLTWFRFNSTNLSSGNTVDCYIASIG